MITLQLRCDLNALAHLLSEPDAWTKGSPARDINDVPCRPLSATAVSWNLEGAVLKITNPWDNGSDRFQAVVDWLTSRMCATWPDAIQIGSDLDVTDVCAILNHRLEEIIEFLDNSAVTQVGEGK